MEEAIGIFVSGFVVAVILALALRAEMRNDP